MKRFAREVVVSAAKHPGSSLASVLLAAALCLTALLTTGRTLAAREGVVAQIDALGTRSIIIRIDPTAAVPASSIEHIRDLREVQSVTGLSLPVDVHNAALDGATPIAARYVFSAEVEPSSGLAEASPATLRALQMPGGNAPLRLSTGKTIEAGFPAELPPPLRFLEPVVLLPQASDHNAAVALIVVTARTPAEVDALASASVQLIGPIDPSKVRVETSGILAQLRSDVDSQLGVFGRGLVLLLFAVATVLTAIILLTLVAMQRKDFGRRRALGATRSYIIALVCAQSLVTSVLGAFIAISAASIGLAVSGSPLPPIPFTVAIGILAVTACAAGATLPGVYASRRDPVHELRIP